MALVPWTAFVLVSGSEAIDLVTFAEHPKKVYVPAREAATLLGWPVRYDPVVDLLTIKERTLDPALPKLSDGTLLISTDELRQLGATVGPNAITFGAKRFATRVGPKRVEVDLKSQVLHAWQGKRLIYRWAVSSGREGKETPNGDFRAQEKEPMHISKLYGSPMPFSVHIFGNIYIHGSDRFSSQPGSHGCIRLPLMEDRNIAKEFFDWIDTGTPVRVKGAYGFQIKGAKT
jgi:lipoprotein-anchoring transpeptidase ErfK/SrfK